MEEINKLDYLYGGFQNSLSSMDPQMAWGWLDWTDELTEKQRKELAQVLDSVYRRGIIDQRDFPENHFTN